MKKLQFLNLLTYSLSATAELIPFRFLIPYFEGKAELWFYVADCSQTGGQQIFEASLTTHNRQQIRAEKICMTQDRMVSFYNAPNNLPTNAPMSLARLINYNAKGLHLPIEKSAVGKIVKGVFKVPANAGNAGDKVQILLKTWLE